MTSRAAIHGALMGTIVGDAMGLPYEALSRRRGTRILGEPTRHRFVLGRGMMSDDGEHTCMVAQALCASGGDVNVFRRSLAWRLRWWLLGIPAGIGGATLRSIIKLWLGFSPEKSGVYSAGNGPAMRSAVLGAAIEDLDTLRQFVIASTRITHTDPKAFHGAMAVAIAARAAAADQPAAAFLHQLNVTLAADGGGELVELVSLAAKSVAAGDSTSTFADQIGCDKGVSGYVLKTVPVAIHAWLRNPTSFESAIADSIRCGGDTDTVAAIAGGILASRVGPIGIPQQWRDGMLEWPRSNVWVESLADSVESALVKQKPVPSPKVGPLVILRNLLFLFVVLVHIARRAFPPY